MIMHELGQLLSSDDAVPCLQDFEMFEGVILRRVIKNIPHINALPARGLNVYDILQHDGLIFTREGLEDVIESLLRPLNRSFKPAGYDWRSYRKETDTHHHERRLEVESWLRGKGVQVPTPRKEA
jgi:hypothetical protein